MITWEDRKDEEIWSNAQFDTVEECIEDAKRYDYKAGDKIYIGDCVDVDIQVYLDETLERIEDNMYEDVGVVSESWDISSRKGREDIYDKYEEKLKELIMEYLKEINEVPSFYKIKNIREVVIK